MHVGAWGLGLIVIVVLSWLFYRYLEFPKQVPFVATDFMSGGRRSRACGIRRIPAGKHGRHSISRGKLGRHM